MVICFIYVNAESIGIGYAILQKYWYWYCNTFFQAVLVLVLPMLFESIVNNPASQYILTNTLKLLSQLQYKNK